VDRRGGVAELGLVGLEQEELRWVDRPEGARDSGSRGQASRPVDGGIGDWMVRVERIGVSVGDQDIRGERPDHVGDPQQQGSQRAIRRAGQIRVRLGGWPGSTGSVIVPWRDETAGGEPYLQAKLEALVGELVDSAVTRDARSVEPAVPVTG
jgi:hypothetical protein